ncbi:TonB-dependent receptor [Sphingopyxis chilensis]|uniref:TonB-dependent receptor n=1 Tax=Sphingopyxis chilensis TaxID=180400 RepID=UPI002DDCB9BC|nr:TonB-dependent receptor [Sphingopyxis chilensis]
MNRWAKERVRLLLSVAVIGVQGFGVAQASEAAASDEVSESPRDEIIVTAQKRSQRLQDVPTSVAVLTGDALIDQGVSNLADYVKQVPGLVLRDGGEGTGQPVIRGINTGSDRGPLVGVYLDDAPLTPSSPLVLAVGFVFDPDLADIDRIEILKGPQSTLYGASAMGGVIRYVTKQPNLDDVSGSFRGELTQVTHGDIGYGLRASLNTPLVPGKVALRASVFHRRQPGYADNTAREKDANYSRTTGGRASLRFALSETVETTFTGLAQDIYRNDRSGIYVNSSLKPLNGYSNRSIFDNSFRGEYRIITNITKVDLDFADLSNILSYSVTKNRINMDVSSIAFLGGPGTVGVFSQNDVKSKRLSNELRLASNPGSIEWLAGFYYDRERDVNFYPFRGTDANGDFLPTTVPGYDIYTFFNHARYDEYAAFGNVTANFSESLEATVGARYSRNKQSFDLFRSGILGQVPIPPLNDTDSKVTYLATVSYKPTRDLTLYVRAASGYRPGSTQILAQDAIDAGVPITYRADTLWNYEAGVKGRIAPGVNFELAAYQIDWKDIQLGAVIGRHSVILNAAKARSRGIEAAIDMQPTPGLSISLRGAHSKGSIKAAVPQVGVQAGDPLPFSPEWSGAAIIDHAFNEGARPSPTIGLTANHQSSMGSVFTETGSTKLAARSLLDLRAGLKWPGFSIMARVDNVFDKFALSSVGTTSDGSGNRFGTLVRPRTFAIAFELKY